MEKQQYIYEVKSCNGNDCVEAPYLMDRLNNDWEIVVLRRDFVVLRKAATEEEVKQAIGKLLDSIGSVFKYLD